MDCITDNIDSKRKCVHFKHLAGSLDSKMVVKTDCLVSCRWAASSAVFTVNIDRICTRACVSSKERKKKSDFSLCVGNTF